MTEQIASEMKMIAFSVGGRDYAVDIMKVREITKFDDFTYVPNAAPFVRGVHNLRGEIVSVIDLRTLFDLPPAQSVPGKRENGLILGLENGPIGVVVDSVDRVVAYPVERIKPPHPLFVDINVEYMSGIVEDGETLYVILDVERMLYAGEKTTVVPSRAASVVQEDNLVNEIRERAGYHVTDVNRQWFADRRDEWIEEGNRVSNLEQSEAEAFVAPSLSRHSGELWSIEYAEKVLSVIPEPESFVVNVWNPGCSNGEESYSIACALSRKFPDRQFKIWALDNDLKKVSTAGDTVITNRRFLGEWGEFVVDGKDGPTFDPVIKDAVLFEYGDVLEGHHLPQIDVVVMRDLVSLFPEEEQGAIFSEVEALLKPSGVLILGQNETIVPGEVFERTDNPGISAFRKKSATDRSVS